MRTIILRSARHDQQACRAASLVTALQRAARPGKAAHTSCFPAQQLYLQVLSYSAMQTIMTQIVLPLALSVEVELPGPFSPDHDREVAAYVAGEISAAELYRRTVARYRQP